MRNGGLDGTALDLLDEIKVAQESYYAIFKEFFLHDECKYMQNSKYRWTFRN